MTDVLLNIIEQFGLFAIFILSALESACIPIPSELVVPPAGWLAATENPPWTLTSVVIAATIGNVAGSWASYEIAKYGGRPLILRYGRYVMLNEQHLETAERWFAKRGELTVFITRMLPAFRTFISVPAGVGKMPLGRFLFYSLLGSIPWNLGLAYAGFQLGNHWERVENYLEPISYVAAALLLIGAVWFWLSQRRKRRN